MEIPLNAQVECSDGPFGRSTYIVLFPGTKRVTHVVVKEKHVPHEEYLVPINQVAESAPHSILLRCRRAEVAKMERFSEVEYISADIPEYMGGSYLWPYVEQRPVTVETEHQHIPKGELVVSQGARVMASDGPVGPVDELLIDSESGRITHLVLREGHLWKRKDVAIPVSKIDRIEGDVVYLTLSRREVIDLPASPPRYMLA